MQDNIAVSMQQTEKIDVVSADVCINAEYDQQILDKIKAITARGNDAEVRRKKDGTYVVYEIKKHII